jgi:hypothetical protein
MTRYNAITNTPQTTTAQTEPSSGPVKKLSFGGIAKKKADTKTAYPVFPDNPQIRELAQRIIERQQQFDALEGALKTDKAEMKCLVTPFYFTHNRGKVEVPSSVAVQSDTGEVLVLFQNRYSKLDSEAPMLGVLGERTGNYFRQAFNLTIDGDKLPTDRAQELLNDLAELFAKYSASDALQVAESVKPVPDFHSRRHLELTPEENVAVEQVCPIVAQVKTKGRK